METIINCCGSILWIVEREITYIDGEKWSSLISREKELGLCFGGKRRRWRGRGRQGRRGVQRGFFLLPDFLVFSNTNTPCFFPNVNNRYFPHTLIQQQFQILKLPYCPYSLTSSKIKCKIIYPFVSCNLAE